MRTTATPAEAKALYDTLKAAGLDVTDRMIAEKLTAAGKFAGERTIRRWRHKGWKTQPNPIKNARPTKVEMAETAMERAVPVLTGDEATTLKTITAEDPERSKFDGMGDDALMLHAAREVFIAAALIMRAAADKRDMLVLASPRDSGLLVQACALAIEAGQKAMIDVAKFRASVMGDAVLPPDHRVENPMASSIEAFSRELRAAVNGHGP